MSRLFAIPFPLLMLAFAGCLDRRPVEFLSVDRDRLELPTSYLSDDQRELTHEFAVTNVSKRPLRIRKWETSCTCTVIEPASRTIAPGESQTVRMTVRITPPPR
jgi:hypothetical protein